MIKQSLRKPAYVHVMWDMVMAIKPIHNTEKEKITKLKADLKNHYQSNNVNKYRMVADKLHLKKSDQAKKISLANAIMLVHVEDDMANDLDVSINDPKGLSASVSTELIKTLKETDLYVDGIEKEDIAYLVSHISTLLLTKKHEVTTLSEDLKTSQQKISDGEALIQRLEELNADLRKQTNKAREHLKLVSQDVKQAVSEEVADLKKEMKTMMEKMYDEMNRRFDMMSHRSPISTNSGPQKSYTSISNSSNTGHPIQEAGHSK